MTATPRPPGPIGILGVGAMGLAMAQRLRDGGHEVVVHDIDVPREALAAAAGCRVAASPAALAAGCALLVVVVVDGAQTDAVLFGAHGAAAALPAGATVMLCPTIAPADVERAAATLAARGLPTIDAPMSGGPGRARDGSMSLMVACDDTVFERWQPLLAWLASRLFRVGTRPGDGARTKLVNNLLAAVNLAGAAEALALALRLGLDPARTLGVIEQSSGQSWIGSDRLHRALAADRTPLARVALLAKDSALALAEAQAAGLDVPVGTSAAARFADALAAGMAQDDDSALWRWLADGAPAGHPPARG
jgi:3-hydroxyisobutyrate dehydrogenase